MPEKAQPRQWNMRGFFPFRLEVLTPVFIGSGDDLSPLEYVIRKTENGFRLHHIDLQSWLMAHASDQSVQNIIASGDIARIRNMLDEKVDAETFSLASSRIADSSLAGELRQAFNGRQNTPWNRQKDPTGNVSAALRNPVDGCLYIPGSSLKGAISTPLINWLDKLSAVSLKACMEKNAKYGMQNRLKEMFGNIGEHAMQALKVSDVAAPVSTGSIVRAKEVHKMPGKKGTPKPPCEAIMPADGDMWGRLLLDCPGQEPVITLPEGRHLPFRELVRICNAFYQKRFFDELKKFYQLSHLKPVYAALQHAQTEIQKLDEHAMLLRVGHYSHIECVTVENNKPYTRKGKNGSPMPFGTTRTLADATLPFGWVLLHFCTQEEYEQRLKESESKRLAATRIQRDKLLELTRKSEEKAAQAAAFIHQQEERHLAQEKKAAEEKAKQEILAQQMARLSPEEALLLKLKNAPSEALSMEVFITMKTWDAALQKKAAETLRDVWQHIGKWSGKQSKKQQAKIQEINNLLSA